mmetsp:Transcript_18044/g.36703  ORF Transcript_18044/g.36703 Transcript_18044/m.36703 type:complete len:205 (-) Transcript_18044:39-653(-)
MSTTSTTISGWSIWKVSDRACAALLCPAPTLPCTIRTLLGGELKLGCSPPFSLNVYLKTLKTRSRYFPSQTSPLVATTTPMLAAKILGTITLNVATDCGKAPIRAADKASAGVKEKVSTEVLISCSNIKTPTCRTQRMNQFARTLCRSRSNITPPRAEKCTLGLNLTPKLYKEYSRKTIVNIVDLRERWTMSPRLKIAMAGRFF